MVKKSCNRNRKKILQNHFGTATEYTENISSQHYTHKSKNEKKINTIIGTWIKKRKFHMAKIFTYHD